jgi:glycosyltransferase involved in cell wall biosynthesis
MNAQESSAPMGAPRLTIVIPVYNEGENITTTLIGLRDRVRSRPIDVVVVYDFDEDSTVPVAQRLQPQIPGLRLHKNDIGPGVLNAVRSGFNAARAPHVLVTMADLSDDAGDVDRMLDMATAGADVVAGSRYMRGGVQAGGPLVKRTLSRVAGLTLHHVGGIPTHDATNNFKIYSRRLLDEVTIESKAGFELAIELTVKAHLMGLRIAEVPTTWRDRSAGESRFRTWAWIPHYFRWYRRGIGARLRRRPVKPH